MPKNTGHKSDIKSLRANHKAEQTHAKAAHKAAVKAEKADRRLQTTVEAYNAAPTDDAGAYQMLLTLACTNGDFHALPHGLTPAAIFNATAFLFTARINQGGCGATAESTVSNCEVIDTRNYPYHDPSKNLDCSFNAEFNQCASVAGQYPSGTSTMDQCLKNLFIAAANEASNSMNPVSPSSDSGSKTAAIAGGSAAAAVLLITLLGLIFGRRRGYCQTSPCRKAAKTGVTTPLLDAKDKAEAKAVPTPSAPAAEHGTEHPLDL
jgi:hypothetical protein